MPKIAWQRRLLIYSVIAALFPLFFSSYNIIQIAEEELKSNLNNELLINSRDIADKIDDKFEQWQNQFVLQRNTLENPNLNSNEKVNLLYEGLRQLKPFIYGAIYRTEYGGESIEEVTLINEDYNVIVENDKIFDEKIQQIDTSKIVKRVTNKIYYYPEKLSKDFWIMSVYIPFRFSDGVSGNLVLKMNLDELYFYLQGHTFQNQGQILVLDINQQQILSESEQELATDEAAIANLLNSGHKLFGATTFTKNGEKYIGSYAFTDYPDWVIFSETTQDKAYLPLRKILQSIFIWVGVGIVFAFLIAWLLYDQISRPITKVSEASGAIAKGNFDVKIDYNVNDSLGRLARTVEEMGKELKSSFEKITMQNRELDEYNKTLEIKVTERTEKLKESNNDLKDAYMRVLELNKQKDEFLGVAAHDLKNPLAAIKGYGELLKDIQDDEVQEYAGTIMDSSDNMLQIISGLLDVNKIEQGSFEPEYTEFDAVKTVQAVVKQNSRSSIIKNIALTTISDQNSLLINYDKTILMQVVDNLVSNAIKFSPFDKEVKISISHSEDSMKLSVKDEGEGISKEDQEKLYQKFTKLSARPTNNENSTGLGLSIVKGLLELTGGSINCVSEPGEGAEFIVTVPVLK